MFRDSPNALVRMDATTRIVDINEAALTVLGGSFDDWLGRSAEDLAVVDDGRAAAPRQAGSRRTSDLSGPWAAQ